MINKIIHYCWFGKSKKSKDIIKCIESWHRFCPDYKFKEWNEDNFNVNCCKYVKQAYDSKKWAFVSDYCRFFEINEYGGIYLDTDVELVKNIDDLLNSPFYGFENNNSINPGIIFGSNSNDIICKKMLSIYDKELFIYDDGTINYRTVCERITDLLCELGLQKTGKFQIVNGISIYPREYFNPSKIESGKYKIHESTYSIHLGCASWMSQDFMKKKIKF